jgi:hypothetical protein
MKRALLIAVGVALTGLPASAQVVRDQTVAQSNFVNRTAVAIPQISMVVRADFVLFSVKYTTSTRSEAARKEELTKQFQAVTERAKKAEGIIIEVGTPGNSASLETAAMKELITNQGADRSAMDLVLKVAVREKDTFETIRTRTEKFVADTPLTGRVEGIIGDSQFLGLSEPKKHRDALIKAISEDVKMMQASFGGSAVPVAVNLTGMEGRVVSRPVGPLDLEIYIPYQMSLRSRRNE